MHRHVLPLVVSVIVLGCGTSQPADSDVANAPARSTDGVLIDYEVHGQGEPTIVLVHGWTNDRGIWGQHLQTLARTHRVVALDLAGHGASGAERSAWTMDAFGADVAAVVNQLALAQVVLVGFSMGGAAVLEAAERLPGRTKGVVFVDVFTDPDLALTAADAEEMVAAFRANWGDTAFLRAFAYSPDTPDSIVVRQQQSMPAQPREHWFAMLPEFVGWIQTQFRPTLQGIEAPVASITTTAQPTNVEAMRQYAPAFTLDTIAGVGHAGLLHERIADFDARLLNLVQRFATGAGL